MPKKSCFQDVSSMMFPKNIFQVSNSSIFLGFAMGFTVVVQDVVMYKHSPSQSLSGSCSINCGTSVVHALSVSLVTSPCLQHAFWFHIYLFLLLHSPYFTCWTPISCSFQSQVSLLSASNPYFRGIFLFMNLPTCFSLEFHSWLIVFPHRVIPLPKAAEDWLGHGYFWRPVPAELWADADWKMENAAGNVAWREYFMAKNGKPGRND